MLDCISSYPFSSRPDQHTARSGTRPRDEQTPRISVTTEKNPTGVARHAPNGATRNGPPHLKVRSICFRSTIHIFVLGQGQSAIYLREYPMSISPEGRPSAAGWFAIGLSEAISPKLPSYPHHRHPILLGNPIIETTRLHMASDLARDHALVPISPDRRNWERIAEKKRKCCAEGGSEPPHARPPGPE
jgi:hypothetical protein